MTGNNCPGGRTIMDYRGIDALPEKVPLIYSLQVYIRVGISRVEV